MAICALITGVGTLWKWQPAAVCEQEPCLQGWEQTFCSFGYASPGI